MKKARLFSWMPVSNGNGLAHYQKAKTLTRFIQVIYAVFAVLLIALKVLGILFVLMLIGKAMISLLG